MAIPQFLKKFRANYVHGKRISISLMAGEDDIKKRRNEARFLR